MLVRNRTGRTIQGLGIAILGTFALSTLANAGTIRGTVLDHEGKPAAGASVWVAKLAFREPLQTHETTADDQGAFSVEAAPGNWAVFARKGNEGSSRTGYSEVPEEVDGKAAEPISITLGPPSNVKGRLLDAETGKPIGGGYVVLDDARKLEVGPDGRFEAPGLELRNHQSFPICTGYASSRVLFDTTLRPESELEVKLHKGGTVVGKVVDVEGKPIPGSLVSGGASGSMICMSALLHPCDENGHYVSENRPIGSPIRLLAYAPGYKREARLREVVIQDAEHPAELNFTLELDPAKQADAPKPAVPFADARNVSGKVVADGKPVTGAIVRWGMITDSNPVPNTKTDAEGHFTLAGMPNETNVLSVMSEGLQPSFPLVDGKGDQTIQVDLKPGATIRGRVVDDAGKPVADARIMPVVDRSQPEWGKFQPHWPGFVYLHGLETETGDDGSFTLEGMPDGVKADILARDRSADRRRELSPDASKNVITLTGEGALRGRVVDFKGNPVRNFRAKLAFPNEKKTGDKSNGYYIGYIKPGITYTRDDGVFTLSGLTAGNVVRVEVVSETSGAGAVDRVVVDSHDHLKPAEDLTITLAPPHILRVHVVREDAKSIENARVTVIGDKPSPLFRWNLIGVPNIADETVTAATDAGGWATFVTLPFGTGNVVARAPGFARTHLQWIGDKLELLAILEPASSISGTVTVEGGKPIEDLRVSLSWGGGESLAVPVDSRTGRYSADALPSGQFQFVVAPRIGTRLSSEMIHLKPGENLVKDLSVTPPAAGAR